jgi:archaellum biogenesis protein FlaJ (TadC family)
MKLKQQLSREYRLALQVSLVFQVAFMLLATMCFGGDQLVQWFLVSLAAYWGGVILIALRRPTMPTKVDQFLIRWGYPMLCVITPLIMILVWKIRGIDF